MYFLKLFFLIAGFTGAAAWASETEIAPSALSWQPYTSGRGEVRDGVLNVVFKKGLTGVTALLKGYEPGIYDVTCRLKGNTSCHCAIFTGNTAFSPGFRLMEEWKDYTARFRISQSNFTLALLSYAGGTACLEKLSFKKVPAPLLADVSVDGLFFEAEQYAAENSKIKKEKTASAQSCVSGMRWCQLSSFPLPASARKLYLFAKAKVITGSIGTIELYSLGTLLLKGQVPADGKWHIVRLGPLNHAETDGNVLLRTEGGADTEILLDCIWISDNPNFEPDNKAADSQLSCGNGFLAVGRMKTPEHGTFRPPDGAMELTPFIRSSDRLPAREKSSVFFSYDNHALYLFFRGEARCLQTLSNMHYAFKRNIAENDSDLIFQDDCIVFMLQPEGTPHTYELVINARGAVTDTRMTLPSIWDTRDRKWNSSATVRTDIGDGVWHVSASIPWKNLGIDPARQKEFRFYIGRKDIFHDEDSSWSGFSTSKGMHHIGNFGKMILVETVPSVVDVIHPSFLPGKNFFRFKTDAPCRLVQRLKYDDGPGERTAFLSPGGSVAEAPVSLLRAEPFAYQFILENPFTLSPLMISPEYKIVPSFLKITGDKSFFVNGEALRDPAPLTAGVNLLAVRIQDGRNVSVMAGKEKFAPDASWKFSENPDKNWNQLSFDDSKWGFSKDLKNGFYRKKIILKNSVVWPNWQEDELYLSPGDVQQLLIYPGGMRDCKTPDGFEFIFEMPENIELLGASGYYNKLGLTVRKSGTDHAMRRYSIFFPEVRKWTPPAGEGYLWCAIGLKINSKGRDGEVIRFFAQSSPGAIQEFPNRIRLKYLAPFKTDPPKHLTVQLWCDWLKAMSDLELRREIYRSMAPMGITEAECAPAGLSFKSFQNIHIAPWSINFTEYIRRNPGAAKVAFTGVRSHEQLCPLQFKTDTVRILLRKEIARILSLKQTRHLNWDYEESVWTGQVPCFCDSCIRAFASEFKLGNGLTPQKIREKHPKEWTFFSNRNFADICGAIHAALGKADRDAHFSVYSGYQGEFTQSYYGVDWRMLHDKIDLGIAGYGRSCEDIEATRSALAPKPFIRGLLAEVYNISNRARPVAWTQAEILEGICDSTGGIMFFSYPMLDARAKVNIAAAVRILSRYEPFFLSREDDSANWHIRGIPKGSTRFWHKDGKILVLLFNTSRIPLKYELFRKGHPEKFNGELAPGSVRHYCIHLKSP